jgi:urease accessory protein
MTGLLGGTIQALAPAHLVALISVGLLAGRSALRECAAVVAAFAAGLATGLGALAAGVGETPAADVLLVVAALCGLAAAAALRLPPGLLALLALVTGLAGGLDSPPDAVSLREAVLSLIGTACAGIGQWPQSPLCRRPWPASGTESCCGSPGHG